MNTLEVGVPNLISLLEAPTSLEFCQGQFQNSKLYSNKKTQVGKSVSEEFAVSEGTERWRRTETGFLLHFHVSCMLHDLI